MNVPNDRYYATTHEWVLEEGNEALIGITDFAQEALGDITYVDMPAVGAILQPAQEMGSVESVKAASEIYSPVAGEVLEVNSELDSAPEIINHSPYENGWLVRVRLLSPLAGLLNAAEYHEHVKNEA